jgi:glycosylphosphatidylinositol phospholipase D
LSATGDINGDGFAEIIVTQPTYDGPFTDSGRVLLFYGGDAGGLDRIPRQFRFDDTAPIGLLGKSDEPASFRVKARGRSPYGRSNVRLEVEIDPLGTPFDGGGTIVSAPVDTGDPVGGGYVDFNEALSGFLVPETPYRWRARVLGDSPLFPHSPWFGLPGNTITETDFRTETTTFPYVQFVSPGIRARGTSVSTNVTVRFSESINPATVTAGTFRLIDNTLGTVGADLAVTPSGLFAVLDPTLALAPGTNYRIELTSGVQDMGGTGLVAFSSTFTTEDTAGTGTPLPIVSDEAIGLAPGSLTGSAVAAAGDLDGDGINDFLGGAPGLDVGGQVEAGGAAVYLGSTSESERERADIIFTGIAAHDRAGTSVAGDFDFDGDGTPDILIGAEQFNRSGADDPVAGCNDDSACGAGIAYLIYFDPADYPNLGNPLVTDYVDLAQVGVTIPGVVFTGVATGDQTGFAVAGGGSLDAGSGDDIAIGAPGATTPGGAGAGILYVVFDDPSLTGTVSLSRVANSGIDEVDGFLLRGGAAGDALGFSVAFPGDVIGNSGSDLAVGAPLTDPPIPLVETGTLNDGGTVIILEGGGMSNGIIETVDVGGGGTNGSTINGDQAEMQFGFSVAGGGDNLADGVDDLLMGAPLFDAAAGPDAGFVAQTSGTIPLNTIIESCNVGGGGGVAGATYVGEAAGDLLGYSVAGVYDTTGNGFDDVVFGAPYADPELVNEAGAVYVVEGRSAEPALQGQIEVSDIGAGTAGRVFIGVEEGEHAGSSLAGTGDISGDGANDFLVGAPDNDVFMTDDDAGQIYLVLDGTLSLRDADGDGVTDPLDCNVNDGSLWGTPGSIYDLTLTHDAGSGTTTLNWSPPGDFGTTVLWYDVMRSLQPGSFTSGAYCIESDQTTDTTAADAIAVPAGSTAYYMVRAENGCPEGAGLLGDGPLGEERSALECPNPDDSDNDGWNDEADNCPADFNQDQANGDADSLGDACDNCPVDTNEDQTNSDADSLGDACDNCPVDANEDQADNDSDTVGNACDNCPDDPNPGQEDGDSNGVGDVCEAVCGDGDVGGTEQCDDAGESATCDEDCTFVVCGDMTTNTTANEDCDEGGETATCDDDCTIVECGDGNSNETSGETCDDAGESATCDADCTAVECGDLVVNTTAGEDCDLGGGEMATCRRSLSGDQHQRQRAGVPASSNNRCNVGGHDLRRCDGNDYTDQRHVDGKQEPDDPRCRSRLADRRREQRQRIHHSVRQRCVDFGVLGGQRILRCFRGRDPDPDLEYPQRKRLRCFDQRPDDDLLEHDKWQQL